VTSGARDRTCRWWKVEEEVQLVLRGGGKTFEKKGEVEQQEDADALTAVDKKQEEKVKSREFVEGSLDVVCMLDDQHFLSGGDSG
jgi:ribosomal RNA-processing protein 9